MTVAGASGDGGVMCRRLLNNVTRYALAALILTLAVTVPALASSYFATISVANSSATAYTNLPVSVLTNNKYMADPINGFTLPDARDVAVETGSGMALPRMVVDDRIMTVTDIPASSSTLLTYTSNNTPSDFSIITGLGGNITVADAAMLEPLGNAVQFDITGYVDTTSNDTTRTLIYKQNAFKTCVNPVGSVEAAILTAGDAIVQSVSTTVASGYHATRAKTITQTVTNVYGDVSDAQTTLFAGLRTRDGQRITLSAYPATFTSLSFWMYKVGAPPVSTAYARIYDSVSGALIGTMGSIDVSTLGGPALQTFVTPVTVSVSDVRLVMEYSGGDGFNCLAIQERSDAGGGGTNPGVQTYYDWAWHDNAFPTWDAAVGWVYTAGSLSLYVDDMFTPAATTSFGGPATISDTATDWFIGSDATPYTANYTERVGVGLTEVVRFAPNDIVRGVAYNTGTATFTNGSTAVTGTATVWDSSMEGAVIKYNVGVAADNIWNVIQSVTSNTTIVLAANYLGAGGGAVAYSILPRLPDLDTATSEEGAITWGANPAGVTLTMGSLSTGPGLSTTLISAATPDTLPPIEQSNWYIEPDVSGALASNPFRPIVLALSSTHSGTVTNLIGTVSGSPVTLVPGTNNVNVTGLGTLTVTLDAGTTAVVRSGTSSVAGSPVALGPGASVITTAVATGDISITLAGSGGGLTTFTEIQIWRFFAMMATLLMMAGGAKIVPGHVGIVGFAQLVGMGGAVAMTIFPLWAIVVAIGLFVATLVIERSQQL